MPFLCLVIRVWGEDGKNTVHLTSVPIMFMLGLFAMIAAFLVQLIELAGHSHAGKSHSHKPSLESLSFTDICTSEKTDDEITRQVSAVVLEFGILVHSLVIGIALGVSNDSTFSALVFAICFHQLFEGLALGVLVGDTSLKKTTKYLLGFLCIPLL